MGWRIPTPTFYAPTPVLIHDPANQSPAFRLIAYFALSHHTRRVFPSGNLWKPPSSQSQYVAEFDLIKGLNSAPLIAPYIVLLLSSENPQTHTLRQQG